MQGSTTLLSEIGSIEKDTVVKLERYDVHTVKDLFSKTVWDLQEMMDVSMTDVTRLLVCVGNLVAPTPVTARSLLERPEGCLRTLLEPLDTVIEGGVQAGGITEVVGPAGLGKTQFCLGMCVVGCLDRLACKGRVLYIDTEKKFSAERLSEIGLSRFPESFTERGSMDEMLRRVIVQVPTTSVQLLEMLQNLQEAVIGLNIVLIVIDSIAALARTEFGYESIAERQKLLGQQASTLKYLAESFHIPIIVTNQITTKIENGSSKLVAALGPMWAHAVNTRLQLTARGDYKRSLLVSKSSFAPLVEIPYKVTMKGLEIDTSEPCTLQPVVESLRGLDALY
jgi:RAD51-like protein 1